MSLPLLLTMCHRHHASNMHGQCTIPSQKNEVAAIDERRHISASFHIDNRSNQMANLECIELLNLLIQDTVEEELRMHRPYQSIFKSHSRRNS